MNHWIRESRLRRARKEFVVSLYYVDKIKGRVEFAPFNFEPVMTWLMIGSSQVDGVVVWRQATGEVIWEESFSTTHNFIAGDVFSINLKRIVEVMK